MKSAIHLIISITLVTAVLAACQSPQTRRNIATADSLSEADPAAAINFIDSVSPAADGRRARMKMALLKAKAMNKLMQPIDSAKLKDIVDYFTDHGTANEKMLANYITACSYVDKDNAPMALQYFHEAVVQADTTDNDCDYHTLQKIHTQIALLLLDQLDYADATEENNIALKYAWKAKDTLNALVIIEQQANIYNNQNKIDSAIIIRKQLYNLYQKYGFNKQAAICLGPLIDQLLIKNNISEAKIHLDNYEKNSGLFDSNGNIEKGREVFYNIKGTYFLKTGQFDSARIYFNKCASNTDDYGILEFSYKCSTELYKRIGIPDSIAKYAELARIMNDSAYKSLSTMHLQRMQAMFNYGTKQQEVVNEREAKIRILQGGITIGIVLIAIIGGLIFLFMKKRRERKAEKTLYEKHITDLETTRYELDALIGRKQAQINTLIDEKNKAIDSLMQKINEYEQKYSSKNIPKRIADITNETVVIQLRTHTKQDFSQMSTDESRDLKNLFKSDPSISQWEEHLSETEYIICLLVRLGFTPSAISVLTGRSMSDISNIRKRLLLKMTGNNGSSKDFDKYIKSL